MNLNITKLSYSSVALWNYCPRAWLLKYHFGFTTPSSLAQSFGTAMHRSIQKSLVDKVSLISLSKTFHKEIFKAIAENKVSYKINDIKNAITLGENILKSPMIGEIFKTINVKAGAQIEHKFEFRVPKVRVPVIGFIDIIDDNGIPYDIKTSKWLWSFQKAMEETQPDFYLTALEYEGIPSPNNEFIYAIVMKTEEPSAYLIETKRENYKKRTHELVQNMWKGVEEKAWEHTIENKNCENCGLRKQCEMLKFKI